MMKLYHCPGSRSLRALWMLEELGLDYELVKLPFPPRVFQKDYLGVNRLGTVPYFIDGETVMTESSAIAHYLPVRYGAARGKGDLAVAPEDAAYGRYLNFLFYSDATLTFPQTIVLRYTQLEPEARRLPQAVADYRAFFYGRLRLVEAALGEGDYLAAGRFTAADIAVGYALLLAKTLKIDDQFSDNVNRYWARLAERPAYQRAAAK